MQKVYFGIDEFLATSQKYNQLKIGFVTNDAALTATGKSSRLAMLEAGFQIVKLFSPEHGIHKAGVDGAFQKDDTDLLTRLPIISLYGHHVSPMAKNVEDLDALVFDMPDVGCRFYTYLWTMTYVMEACAANNKLFILLDRPNPLCFDIRKAEGPMLNEVSCSSFIGRWKLPITHSCSLGELANYFWKTRMPHLKAELIKIKNWNRNKVNNVEGWNFVSTSPAIKDLETVRLYPGMALLEGINVNEGRGTDNDFKMFGSPWMDAELLLKNFKLLNVEAVEAKVINYLPTWGLYANQNCKGLALTVTDVVAFKPVATGLALIKLLIKLFPHHCKERLYKTNANPSGLHHLDKLLGVENAFLKLKNEMPLTTELLKEDWETKITPYLLY